MKITENKLLTGYEGLTNGLSIISTVRGQRICWTYRAVREDCRPMVDGRDAAGVIELEHDRSGILDLARRLTAAQQATHTRIRSAYAAIIGEEV